MSYISNRDTLILNAINEVKVQEGVDVSVQEKGKGLRKFGVNSAVGTTFETVAQFQGTVANETYVVGNTIKSVSSSSASDNTQTLVVEGHTVDGNGLMTFVSQDVVLNGQTIVILSTPLHRANRMYVKQTGTRQTYPADLVGIVYCWADSGTGATGGVPKTDTDTKITIQAGQTQSQKCATSISDSDYYFINNFSGAVGVAGGSASRVEIIIEIRSVEFGGAWLPQGRIIELNVGANGVNEDFNPMIIVRPNTDIRVRAKVDSNTAEVTGAFSGYLASIIN